MHFDPDSYLVCSASNDVLAKQWMHFDPDSYLVCSPSDSDAVIPAVCLRLRGSQRVIHVDTTGQSPRMATPNASGIPFR